MNIFKSYSKDLKLNVSGKGMSASLIEVSKKPFIRNVFVVVSGTALAQVITTLFSPVLTRVYGPEAMGIYGTFSSVVSIAAPIAALTFPVAIVIAKEDREAKDLAYLSLILSVMMSLLTFALFVLFGEGISQFLQVSSLKAYLLLVPVVMWFSAILDILNQWSIRKKRFDLTAKAGVFHALITNFLKLFFGLIAPTAASLIIITTIGTGLNGLLLLVGTGIMTFLSVKSIQPGNLEKRISQVARKYKEFPIYRSPQAFINALALNLPILILTTLFGPAAAGFYALGNKVLLLPVTLIGDSVGNVFYPRFSQANNEGEDTTKLLMLATLSLFVIGILPFSLLIIFGPQLFSLIFGQDWVTAGIYARWIGVWTFTTFISRPAVQALPVLKATRFHLVHTIASILCKSAVLLIGAVLFKSDIMAMALYGLMSAALNFWLITVTISKCRTNH